MQPFASAGFRCKQQRRGVDEVLLHQGDERKHVVRERLGAPHTVERAEQLRIHPGEHRPHDDPFLEPVQEQAFAIGRVLAQQARAEAVKRRDPRLPVVVLQALVDPAADLTRGTRRKRQDENLVARGHASPHGLLVQIDERVGLSGARPGQHTEWSIDFLDVEWQGVSPVGGGRPDYAGARVLESAHMVKGHQAAMTIARSSAISSQGHSFNSGLKPFR